MDCNSGNRTVCRASGFQPPLQYAGGQGCAQACVGGTELLPLSPEHQESQDWLSSFLPSPRYQLLLRPSTIYTI